MKILEMLCSLAGWAIFLAVGVGFALQHGKRWEFGPHGVTRLLVAEDGINYRDGTPIDPLTLSLHKSGQYETCQFVMLGILGALLARLAYRTRRDHQIEMQQAMSRLADHEMLGGDSTS
jgi:hypothetical protein